MKIMKKKINKYTNYSVCETYYLKLVKNPVLSFYINGMALKINRTT